MAHQGKQMKRKANTVRGRTKVGDILKLPLSNADLSKGDNKILTLAAVGVKLHSKESSS